jgi:DNA polymerase-1
LKKLIFISILFYSCIINAKTTNFDLLDFLNEIDTTCYFPEIVKAQTVLETGWFTSSVCVNKHNYFGMTQFTSSQYAYYHSWKESIKAYSDWQKRKLKKHPEYFKNKKAYYKLLDSLYCFEVNYSQRLKILINCQKFKYLMSINAKTAEAYQLMHDGILALSRAEQQGIRIDATYVANKKAHLTRKIEKLEKEFYETNFFKHWQHSSKGKVNINSDVQLGYFLYSVKKLQATKLTVTGKGSTDEESLKQLNIPELNNLLEIGKLKKLRDTYLEAFERESVNGYIHPFFNLHLARTYRSSSDHPNFQNIPKRDEESMQICRRALFPRPGHLLLEPDFSGIEVRIAACYHKDPTMLKYIKDPKSDMHGDMAKQIFKIDNFDKKIPSHYTLRQAAKNGFVFPQFYGDYYKNCATNMACEWGKLSQGKWRPGQGIEMLDWDPKFNNFHLSDHLISKGIKSFQEFTEHIKDIEKDFWSNRFKVYAHWKETHYNTYLKNGYVDLKTGFRCSGIMGKNDVINYPVQGAAFHCLLWSFIEIDRIIQEQKLDSRLIGQIHDSMLIDVNPNELNFLVKEIQRITCEELPKHWSWINIPMEIDMDITEIDQSWATKKGYKV